jgi:hypothetical protein
MAEKQMPMAETEESVEIVKRPAKPQAKVKQLTTGQKIKKAFIADEITDVKSYAIFDVVIPSIKKVIRELVMNAIDMVFYGKPQARTSDRRRDPYYDWSRISRDDRDDRRDDRRRSESRGQQFVSIRELDRVVFEDKEDAINALASLMDSIEEFGAVTVADFLGEASLPTNPIHSKWGWYDLQGCSVRQTPDGDWYVDLPRAKPIT